MAAEGITSVEDMANEGKPARAVKLTSAQMRKQGFVKDLLARVADGAIELVAEPKLNGPLEGPAPEGAEGSFYVALYPKTEAARNWVLANRELLSMHGRVEPFDAFHGKYYLRDEQEKAVLAARRPLANDGLGAHRPIALDKLAIGTRLAISRVHDTLGHKHALLVAADHSARETVMSSLRTSRILARKEGDVAEYEILSPLGSNSSLLAVPLDEKVAHSLLANTPLAIEDWTQPGHEIEAHGTLALDELMRIAHRRLPVESRKRDKAGEPEKSNEPEPAPVVDVPKTPLASMREPFMALHPEVVEEPKLDGSVQHHLVLDTHKASQFALKDKSTLEDPLRLTDFGQAVSEGRARYVIGKDELARVEGMFGTLARLAPLPMNESPLKRLFRPVSRNGMKDNVRVGSVIFAEFNPGKKKSPAKHYMYVSCAHSRGADRTRLQAIADTLRPLGAGIDHMTQEDETPELVRFSVSKILYDALMREAAVAQGLGHTRVEHLGASRSEQSIQGQAFELAGVKRTVKDNAQAPKHEERKLTNGDAQEFLRTEVNRFLASDEAQGHRMIATRIARKKKEGKDTYTQPVILLRGKVRELNTLANLLNKRTASYTLGSEIRLHGKKSEGKSKGILEIAIQDDQRAAFAASSANPELANDVLPHDTYRDTILALFKAGETKDVQRNARNEAWGHLAQRAIIAVEVSAPDKEKLDTLRDAIAQQQVKMRAFTEPLRQLETLYEEHLSAMVKEVRDSSKDRALEREAQQLKELIRRVRTSIEQDTFFTQTRGRLDVLQAEYARIREVGTRIDYLVLDPQARSARLLAPLIGNGIDRIEPVGHSALHITTYAPAQFADTLKQHGKMVGRPVGSVVVDDVGDFADKRHARWIIEQEAVAASAKNGNIPTMIVTEPKRVGEHTRTSARQDESYVNLPSLVKDTLGGRKGILAYEQQEPKFTRALPIVPIAKQAVLVVGVEEYADTKALIRLRDGLKEAGLLLERPRVYGEVVEYDPDMMKLHEAEQAQDANQVSDALSALENRKSALTKTMSILTEFKFHGTREGAQHVHAAQECWEQLREQLVIEAQDNVPAIGWRRTLAMAVKAADNGALLRAIAATTEDIRAEMQAVNDELYDAAPKEFTPLPAAKPGKHKQQPDFVTSLRAVEEGSDFYPVDGGSAKNERQLDTWRHVVRTKHSGTSAMKLYLKPEAVPVVAEILATMRGDNVPCNASQDAAFAPERIAARMFQMLRGRDAEQLAGR